MIIYSKENNQDQPKKTTQSLLTKTQRNLHTFISKTHNTTPKQFKQYITFQLLHNAPTHLVSIFKEQMINDYIEEFLKREYSSLESKDRLPKFAKFYKNYLQFFCKPTLRHFALNEIVKNYGEEKAELYYKENYPEENIEGKHLTSHHFKYNEHHGDDDSDSEEDDIFNSRSTIFTKSIKENINKGEDGSSFFNDINKAMKFPLTQRCLKTFERIDIETLNGHILKPNMNNNTDKNSRNITIVNLLNNLKIKQKVTKNNKQKGNINIIQVTSQKGQKIKCFIKQQIHHKYINNAHYYDNKHKNAMSYTNLKQLIKYNTLLESTLKNSKHHKQTSSFKTVVQHPQQPKIKNVKTAFENITNYNNKSRNKQFESNLNCNGTNSLTKKKLMNYTYRTVDYHIHSPKIMNKISLIKPSNKSKHKNKVSPQQHNNHNLHKQNHQVLSFSSNSITNRKTRTESSLGKNNLVKKGKPRVKPLSSIRKHVSNGKKRLVSSPKSAKSNSNSSRNVNNDKAALMKIALSVLLDNHKTKHQHFSKTSSLNINIKNSINIQHSNTNNNNNRYNNKSRNVNRSNIGLESFLKSNYNNHTHNKNLTTFLAKKNINLKKKGYGLGKALPRSKEHKK